MPDKRDTTEFDLDQFLPYLLNQAAEATSRSFQAIYKARYGMTRPQWRVLANLGKFGAMTASDICRASNLEKPQVSRAVAALEDDGLLSRAVSPSDRRSEILTLTARGRGVFTDLGRLALDHNRAFSAALTAEEAAHLRDMLRRIAALRGDGPTDP